MSWESEEGTYFYQTDGIDNWECPNCGVELDYDDLMDILSNAIGEITCSGCKTSYSVAPFVRLIKQDAN